ncbi:cytochrome c [Alcanivorax sp. S71-1-4]|uniref:cytochrome c n=1 Tax=Alcanivorax sp. S71-1-4 TaxID=1177159 RepID=UPI00135CCC30|nr:cytochrome c [Alcanivorax sp. S71-1-4]KAF0810853.1 cytochrome c [Alcanivorax sp. S71-1-4]
MRHNTLLIAPLLALTPLLHAADAEQIQRGEYLARIGDCVACHTAPGGASLAGGLPMETPVGAIYTTNITPDKDTGIGHYTLDDFTHAMREGVARDGHHLYPAMPYPSFAKVSDDDIADLYAYFMHGVKPVSQPNKDADIPWPLSMRWPLAMWKMMFLKEGVYEADSEQDAEWNRGAYLVQGLGHCGACHTPRGLAFQEKALTEADDAYLSGATLDGWWATSLRGDWRTGIGSLSVPTLVQLLKTGFGDPLSVSGPMDDVITHSTTHLSDEDLTAMAVYLKSLSDQPATHTTRVNEPVLNGGELYSEYCATCHRDNGAGYPGVTPALSGNPTVLADHSSSAIRVILYGARSPDTGAGNTQYAMPGYGWQLSDTQIAALVNYLNTRWGNQGDAVNEKDVASMR